MCWLLFILLCLLWQELSSSISEVDSPGMDLEFPGDDVTDEEIGSIMEQLSQLAGSAGDLLI